MCVFCEGTVCRCKRTVAGTFRSFRVDTVVEDINIVRIASTCCVDCVLGSHQPCATGTESTDGPQKSSHFPRSGRLMERRDVSEFGRWWLHVYGCVSQSDGTGAVVRGEMHLVWMSCAHVSVCTRHPRSQSQSRQAWHKHLTDDGYLPPSTPADSLHPATHGHQGRPPLHRKR